MPAVIIINKQAIAPGENKEVTLNIYRLPTRTVMEIPVHVFRSSEEGPCVLISAGLHGDEINGIEIIRTLLREGHFTRLKKGSVLAMPIINIISFLSGSRELPDGKDLNRCFPGSVSGSLGSRIAYDLMQQVIPQIDLGIDFHTGGAKINNFPQVRCTFDEEKNLEYGKLFGAPFVINSALREKSLRAEAARLGKPILVYEAGESMRFNSLAIGEGVSGCLRLLHGLGMLDAETAPNNTRILMESRWIRAGMSGLFRTRKKYGAPVKKNEVVGWISDPFGETELELLAPSNGYIVGINNQPVVNEGDALIHIGVE
ncbi:MAG: succinylglutamate desuccinylase/aspartoacylase family protein [Bacteroidia bacterium]|nr:succinylglutamate desuccinylase/aspartoacylase family protein [Bacteroidia bacterium]